MMKIAFYDAKPYDREFFPEIAADGLDFVFHPFRLSATTASTAEGARAVCIFVNDSADRECLELLAEMGVGMVALRCAGFNNVDLKAAAELGIVVSRVPAYSPEAVAEHAVALLLTLNRKIHTAYNRVREHNFSLNGLVGFNLHGKTAGIIGTGKIGQVTAQILGGFGMRTIAFDPYPAEKWADSNGVKYVDLPTLYAESDVISLHAPLTPETEYMIDSAAIKQMKKGVYLVNTSRGKLIDTTALIAALKVKRLGGVALDVYEIEENVFFEDLSQDVLQDDELVRLVGFPNVLITSHQAFLTREALSELARVTSENLLRFEAGKEFLPGTKLGQDRDVS